MAVVQKNNHVAYIYLWLLCYQGLVEKQLFIADEHVTLNKYISATTTTVPVPVLECQSKP